MQDVLKDRLDGEARGQDKHLAPINIGTRSLATHLRAMFCFLSAEALGALASSRELKFISAGSVRSGDGMVRPSGKSG
ncbi:hypothetical protein Plhal304r1_c011g0043611 [Plasmopara halstedii]